MKLKATIIASALVLSGCKTTGFLKQVESKAYDGASISVSQYCARMNGSYLLENQRVEARRALRARGTHGPKSPTEPVGLETDIANGNGPVVRIYCAGDYVPKDVWEDLTYGIHGNAKY